MYKIEFTELLLNVTYKYFIDFQVPHRVRHRVVSVAAFAHSARYVMIILWIRLAIIFEQCDAVALLELAADAIWENILDFLSSQDGDGEIEKDLTHRKPNDNDQR